MTRDEPIGFEHKFITYFRQAYWIYFKKIVIFIVVIGCLLVSNFLYIPIHILPYRLYIKKKRSVKGPLYCVLSSTYAQGMTRWSIYVHGMSNISLFFLFFFCWFIILYTIHRWYLHRYWFVCSIVTVRISTKHRVSWIWTSTYY